MSTITPRDAQYIIRTPLPPHVVAAEFGITEAEVRALRNETADQALGRNLTNLRRSALRLVQGLDAADQLPKADWGHVGTAADAASRLAEVVESVDAIAPHTHTTTHAAFNADRIAEILTTNGHRPIAVETCTNGWRAVSAKRDAAFSIARLALNNFDGDPESGACTVTVQPDARGFATIVTVPR